MRNLKVLFSASFLCAVLLLLGACGQGDSNGDVRITSPASPLTSGTVGTAFTATFTARGDGPITWSVSMGTLPPGITLNAMSGLYAGTPTTAGVYTFTVTATGPNSANSSAFTHEITAPAVNANALMSGNNLAAFDVANPGGLEAPVALTGITAGDVIVSIDRRPQNGSLIGLGYNATAGTVQLYAISSTTGVTTPIGPSGTFVGSDGATPVRVGVDATTLFGIDFNPTVDRVRVVNSAGQNFRMNPNTGAFVDGSATTAGINMDGAINGTTTSVQETAYTNNAANVTVTTQYTLDSVIDSLCIQNPPNNGTQTSCQMLTSMVESVQGFDIPPGVNVATSNSVATGSGFVVTRVSGATNDVLARVDLTSGALTTVGSIGANIVGIAVQQPAATPLIALSADGTQLIRFSSAAPGTATTAAITGVTAGETLTGLDYRPQTGQLYTLGVADALNTATLYLLDPQTGVATAVGTAGQVAFVDGTGAAVDLPPVSVGYGFDFNPTVDRVRVTTTTGLNFRINPNNGAPVDGNLNNTMTPPAGTNTDGLINGQPAGSTGVSAAAYTNSFGQSLTGGTTTQYVVDADSNMLFIQNPPNAGTLTAGRNITLNGSVLDFTAANGFDIPSQVRSGASNTPVASGSAFAALTVGTTTRLYSINLVNGQATDLGALAMNVSALAAGQTTVR